MIGYLGGGDSALDYAAPEEIFENATRLLVVLLKIKHSSRVDEVIDGRLRHNATWRAGQRCRLNCVLASVLCFVS